MKVTNKYNLPEAYLRVVSNDEYTRGRADVTASELGLPARVFALKRKHEADLEVDASELLPILLGKAVHNILERADKENVVEERLFTTVANWVVGGKFDNHTEFNGVLTDWKTTRVDALLAKTREGFKEWVIQMNTYAYLLKKAGRKVESLRVIAFMVDFSPVKKRFDAEYPTVPVQIIELPIWEDEVIEHYLNTQIEIFKSALVDLPECSDADRWTRGGQTAVMKEGRKKAVKLFDNETEAKAWLAEQNDAPNLYLQNRPKEYIRCQFYCPVSNFCEQWKRDQLTITKE